MVAEKQNSIYSIYIYTYIYNVYHHIISYCITRTHAADLILHHIIPAVSSSFQTSPHQISIISPYYIPNEIRSPLIMKNPHKTAVFLSSTNRFSPHKNSVINQSTDPIGFRLDTYTTPTRNQHQSTVISGLYHLLMIKTSQLCWDYVSIKTTVYTPPT